MNSKKLSSALVYKEPLLSIFNGDCQHILDEIDDNSVDMVLTSPPYDDLRVYKGFIWNETVWKSVIKSLFRVVKEGGVVIWIVGDATKKGSETGNSFKQALWAKECGFNLHDTMIYQKDNPPPVGGRNRYYQHFEYMFVWSKGKPATFNPITSERRNKWNDKRIERVKGFTRNKQGEFVKKKVSLIGDVKIGNIWKYMVGGGISVEYGVKYPAGFPEKLVHDHLLSWSNEGDVILDPFMGSGTTLLVARKLNRKAIGLELSDEYCNYAVERLDRQTQIDEYMDNLNKKMGIRAA